MISFNTCEGERKHEEKRDISYCRW
jgi:hypothetical protein